MNQPIWEIRRQQRRDRAKRINKERSDHMRQKLCERLTHHVEQLQGYADHYDVPENVVPPQPLPMVLDQNTIQIQPYRQYMVRRFIQHTGDLITEVKAKDIKYVHQFHFTQLLEQNRAIANFITLLDHLPSD